MLRIIKENRRLRKENAELRKAIEELCRIYWIQSALRASGSYQPVSGWREHWKRIPLRLAAQEDPSNSLSQPYCKAE